MINFLIGKPGDGKTMRAVRGMLMHLRSLDPRPIVTNIILKEEFSVQWLVENSDRPSDFWYAYFKRQVFYLEEEQLTEFYRYRGDLILTKDTDISVPSWGGANDKFPAFKFVKTGVVYFIDEIHIPFSSYKGQDRGPQVSYYLSQHRHMCDDVWCITQHPDQVAVALRRLTFAYIQVRNMYRLKFGPFKMPGKFVEKHFPEVPRRGQVAMLHESFPLEPLIGKCYDTTASIGIGANRAPELVKAKGIPLNVLWVAGLVVLILITLGPYLAAKAFFPSPESIPQAQKEFSKKVVSAPAPVTPSASVASVPAVPSGGNVQSVPAVLPAVKVVRLGASRQVTLILEDGREVAAVESGYSVSVLGDTATVNGVPVMLVKTRPMTIK
ncbi:MAG: zonular occludens toxin domain-containing protein [Puniceicoccales bacterium]|jgi:hypothetical protein|nr:zonular occludens toxin domain-containing protein [Puniceicoccales bacterium]